MISHLLLISGLHILPLHTVFKADARMIGDTKVKTPWGEITAFENHSGRTYFDKDSNLRPLGKMINGYGNNPEDGVEGLHYKKTIGSYSHGPMLRNLNLAQAIVDDIVSQHETRAKASVSTAEK